MAAYEDSPPDEGYSEDPLTMAPSGSMRPWETNMSEQELKELIMSLVARLPTSGVAEIAQRLVPRLYIDFVTKMPPEVCLKILGFLDPVSLINTARTSREWMLLSFDRKLWEELYHMEGFRVIRSEIEAFEETLNVETPRAFENNDDQHARKRRATPQRVLPTQLADRDSDMMDVDTAGLSQTSIFGGRLTKEPVSANLDIPQRSPSSTSSRSAQPFGRLPASMQNRTHPRLSTSSTRSWVTTPLIPISSLVVIDRGDNKRKLNWQYLYSQRRRLEANWEAERYTNFQLPHPSHPEEAHEECIYTIQHSGKYLVSGSRDKTLRIWDLNTQRLVRPPLQAHLGSVLCLQFDADPEEDLIVSGSSDSTVVLWKFSTGQVLLRIRKAHRESVLNVRFDKRVLVTCSKDKTIKIFNRRPIMSGDTDFPMINPVPVQLNNFGFNPSPGSGIQIKQAYSMVGCLEGHGAAVNAVQIFGNEVVSASGDRTVKVWNWQEGTCTRTLIGHTKGIACVQYDGRRIVSGSSDNEVKVFDKESGLEVASLRAHSNLVRTVQAGFGDLPNSAEEDREDAKAIDHEYFKAVDSGAVSRTVHLERGRPRNAGSRKPEDITAYGAKLPPGGGGGKFGRIVSGSYDETIIIWRRDKEGVWRAQHTLRQEVAAARAASAIQEPTISSRVTTSQGSSSSLTQQAANLDLDVDAPSAPLEPGSQAYYRHLIDVTVPQGPEILKSTIMAYPRMLHCEYLWAAIGALPPPHNHLMLHVVEEATVAIDASLGSSSTLQLAGQTQAGPSGSHGPSSFPHEAQGSASTSASQGHPNTSHHQTQASVLPTAIPAAQHPLPPYVPNPAAAIQPPTAPAPATAAQAPQVIAHGHHHRAPNTTNMARVFKLQFDARRIICCSQTSVIVGWDFANADEQIIEASRFFAPIE